MKTYIHFWLYLFHFILKWEMFRPNAVEKIKTHILYLINIFPENPAVYEIMWKNIVEFGRPQMTIWRIRISCWIPKSTDTHSEYAILIAFALQQCWHERDSTLPYKYIACFINPSNAKLNRICHLLTLLGARHTFHVSRIRVNSCS
jgi:hypothetical protein